MTARPTIEEARGAFTRMAEVTSLALQHDAVARSREYSIVLFDEDRIGPAMIEVARRAGE